MFGLVSIIMPSYNTSDFIGDSINSVLNQTYKNWELIIIDDNSSDNTADTVQSFNDSRIRYLVNSENKGAAFSRNRALREAKGNWIAFLDSDDIWYPNKLENQLNFMVNTNCSFSYTNYKVMGEATLVTGPKIITKKNMYRYCWPGCLTVMYNAKRVGLLQISEIEKNNDYAMWLSVSEKENCYLLDETLAEYRKHRKNSISNVNKVQLIKWHYLLFRKCLQKSLIESVLYTVNNLIFGMYKKIVYIK
ncbi:glycosyltransferase family 2 protein [Enterococcus cecorum]|nr:glycosyltransferase family 2 protein [Enterococcus cecorum]